MSSLIDPYDLIAPKNYGTKGVPHDAWTLLRKESPVHRCEFGGDFEDFWAITRHADIIDVSSKPHLFSNREGPMILSREQKIQVARSARRARWARCSRSSRWIRPSTATSATWRAGSSRRGASGASTRS